MSGADLRRVVVGLDDQGRSAITGDGSALIQSTRPNGLHVHEIWRVDELPATPAAGIDERQELSSGPSATGVTVRRAVFPPDSSVSDDAAAAYDRAAVDLYGDAGGSPARVVPGMHRTDTIDVVTVIDGELWMVTETDETRLRAGDSVVQRGTWHAWRNRSDRPCVVVSTMIAARPRSATTSTDIGS